MSFFSSPIWHGAAKTLSWQGMDGWLEWDMTKSLRCPQALEKGKVALIRFMLCIQQMKWEQILAAGSGASCTRSVCIGWSS